LPIAFVFINSESGAEDELVEELKKIENVVETHGVYGVYDVVVKVKADTMDELKDMVHLKIRSLDNVRSTLTMIVMEDK
jgi:DNA-binding Lrp family transcriptional regulator